MDLWEQEGFQPVVKFLHAMREEALLGFRTIDLTVKAEDVKTRITVLKTQYNLANLLSQLPKAVKDAEDIVQKQENKVAQFRNSQEGGNL